MDRKRRKELRVRRRFSCELRSDERRHVGAILDLSASGLFVQTRLQPRTRLRVPLEVRLALPAQGLELALATELVRHFRVPSALFASAGGGVGLRIQRAPDAWRDFVASLSPNARPARDGAEPALASAPRLKAPRGGCLLCSAPLPAGAALCARCRAAGRRSA